MARPSAASLNSLANVLRDAQPLYRECRSILNYLDEKEESAPWLKSETGETGGKLISANKDAASPSLAVFERYSRGVI
jgi:hypothetical protein